MRPKPQHVYLGDTSALQTTHKSLAQVGMAPWDLSALANEEAQLVSRPLRAPDPHWRSLHLKVYVEDILVALWVNFFWDDVMQIQLPHHVVSFSITEITLPMIPNLHTIRGATINSLQRAGATREAANVIVCNHFTWEQLNEWGLQRLLAWQLKPKLEEEEPRWQRRQRPLTEAGRASSSASCFQTVVRLVDEVNDCAPDHLAPKGWILFCGASSALRVLALQGREGPETHEDRASSKDGDWF